MTLVNENSSGVYKLDFTGEEINSKLSSINQLTSDVTNLQNNKISKTSYSTPHSGTFYINGSPIIGGVNGKATLRAYIDSSNYGAQLALTNSLIDDYNGYWANLQVKDKDLINTYNLRLSPKFGIEYRINEDRYPIFHTGNIKTINGNSLLATDDNTDIAITTDNISISINRLFNTSETLEVGQYYIFNQPGYSEISTTFSFQNTEQPTILEEIFGEIQTYASPLVWSTNLAINWSNNYNVVQLENNKLELDSKHKYYFSVNNLGDGIIYSKQNPFLSPLNLRLDTTFLVWNEDPNAEWYTIYCDNEIVEDGYSLNIYDCSNKHTTSVIYKIVAHSSYYTDVSAELTYNPALSEEI